MSIVTIVEVRCDECGAETESGWQVGWMAREEAAKDGWQVSLRGARDRCPDCVDVRAGRSGGEGPDLW